MNPKSFTPIFFLLLLAGVLVVGGVWYFENHSSSTSSTVNESTSPDRIAAIEKNARFLFNAAENGKQYTIGVYASNETSSLSDDDCANGEHEEYQGDYELATITDNALVATTSIGEYKFTPFIGASVLTPTNPGAILVAISQYGTCNGNFDFLYAMNSSGKFKQATFVNKQGAVENSIFVSDARIGMNNNLLNIGYYNNAGTSTVGDYDDTYSYDASNARFLFVSSVKK
jgi:uncharacterized protein (UPF0333 family)